MSKLESWKCVLAVLLLYTVSAFASSAPMFRTLASFDGTNGTGSFATLVQGTDGSLYGTTKYGGTSREGTIFKMSPTGKLTTLYSFCAQDGCADGAEPQAGLVQGKDGNFYGTTGAGGTINNGSNGTVFKMTPKGSLTTLYSFCSGAGCPDGAGPQAGLVQATDGNLYGTTAYGGNRNGFDTYGTVFKITPGGSLATLHSFSSTDGAHPMAGLAQGTDGNLYGITAYGGGSSNCLDGCGTVFKITLGGTLTTLHSFESTDGAQPVAGLLQGKDRNFYGITELGGASSNCNGSGCGTVFRVAPGGALTTLYSFCSQTKCRGGSYPNGLIQGTDGDLYGTTFRNRSSLGFGMVFRITSRGNLTTLHSFSGGSDGGVPNVGLVQATDGTFYGTTGGGGAHGDGTVFSLSVGLAPFVESRPTSGKVAASVVILGTNLTGTSSVTFNGTAARFTVVSKSEIKANAPAGATSGKIKVKTPHGTLISNVVFRVTH
jgi:uncharacterized repeat protein (TIGR03803 family)